MIAGSTVILNEEYIDELQRHRDKWKQKFEDEPIQENRREYEKSYKYYEEKLNKAIDFQDTIEEIINIDMPRMAAVKTITGVTLPLSIVKII